MKSKYLILLFLATVLTGCVQLKDIPYEPARLDSLKDLNGTYPNYGDSLASALGLGWKDIDLITLNFENDNKLNLSYPTDTGIVRLTYKGELKDNFFETYSEKKKLITILVNDVSLDRIRIGRNKQDGLFIQREYSYESNFLFFGAASDGSASYNEPKDTINRLYPFMIDNKWGYKSNIDNSIVIEPEYDYAKLFEDGIARVKMNGKWQLIDNNGQALTEAKYDKIEPFRLSHTIAMAYIGNKKGFLDEKGKEIVPVLFDELKYGYSDYYGGDIRDDLIRVRMGDKYGYINMEGIVYPPVFDKADVMFDVTFYNTNENGRYGKVKIAEESYLADNQGYLYKYKNALFGINKKIVPDTKIYIYDFLNEKGIPYTISPFSPMRSTSKSPSGNNGLQTE